MKVTRLLKLALNVVFCIQMTDTEKVPVVEDALRCFTYVKVAILQHKNTPPQAQYKYAFKYATVRLPCPKSATVIQPSDSSDPESSAKFTPMHFL